MGYMKDLLITVYGGGEDAVKAAQKLSTAGRWIPVSERLPEESHRVSAVTAERGLTVAWIHRERTGDLVWVTLDDLYGAEVTHWMPLPEPPEAT